VVKAKTLADLERDLQGKQQAIMLEAKQEIDALNDQANAAKLHALVEAQEQASKDISQLTDQVAVLGQLDTQNLLQSTTTTIITSQAQATGNTQAVPVTETDHNTQIAIRR
jgi:Zn-dependent oligopeptidase